MRQLALIGLVLWLTTTMTPVQSTNAQAGCLPSTSDGSGEVTLSGEGMQNTAPFDLIGGAYTVRWSGATANRPGMPGNVIVYLKRTDGPLGSALLANTAVTQQIPAVSGETHVYSVQPGAFYFAVQSPGAWTVSITPM